MLCGKPPATSFMQAGGSGSKQGGVDDIENCKIRSRALAVGSADAAAAAASNARIAILPIALAISLAWSAPASAAEYDTTDGLTPWQHEAWAAPF